MKRILDFIDNVPITKFISSIFILAMAVIMVAGNQPRMPKGILQGVRTLTGNIVIEMGYATGLHREALIATGVVLFVFILLINLCFSALKRGKKA